MAWGVEARVPFLDHRLIEFAQKIPYSVRYGSNGKEWLKEAFSTIVPDSILYRKKSFFPSMADDWVRGEGLGWASEILLSPHVEIARWFDQRTLQKWLVDHNNRNRNLGRALWGCIVLELWLKARKNQLQFSNE
jgi:asparagine synthase (glutamine-hydrolysing)